MDECTFEVGLRWRDLDHQGHVYHATVLTLLDEARTEWFRASIGIASPDEYVVARVTIDYRGEITRADDRIIVTFGMDRVGTTSLTTREVARAPDGRLLAEAAITAVLWDRTSHRPRSLLPQERGDASRFVRSDEDDLG
jgi:acyl-CoA thioester hydrolase